MREVDERDVLERALDNLRCKLEIADQALDELRAEVDAFRKQMSDRANDPLAKLGNRIAKLSNISPVYRLPAEIEAALLKLNDAICSHERETKCEYTLLLLPHTWMEPVIVSVDGKPTDAEPQVVLDLAVRAREESPWIR